MAKFLSTFQGILSRRQLPTNANVGLNSGFNETKSKSSSKVNPRSSTVLCILLMLGVTASLTRLRRICS